MDGRALKSLIEKIGAHHSTPPPRENLMENPLERDNGTLENWVARVSDGCGCDGGGAEVAGRP